MLAISAITASAAVTPPALPEGTQYRIVFITTAGYKSYNQTPGQQGETRDIAYYNNILEAEANLSSSATMRAATFRLVGSHYNGSVTTNAPDVAGMGTPDNIPVYNTKGELVANGSAEFWSRVHLAAMNGDRNGDTLNSNAYSGWFNSLATFRPFASAGQTFWTNSANINPWDAGNVIGSANFLRIFGISEPTTTVPEGPEIGIYNGASIASPELSDGQAAAVDFGSVVLGSAVTRDFTIRNTGNSALTIGTITFTGTSPGCYSVTSAAPGSIAVGGTATVTVRFSPCGSGVRGATMNIASNDANENPFDFPIVGTGINPDQDGDGIPDEADLCPTIYDPGNPDFDQDLVADACDPDDDNDGVTDASDADPFNANSDSDNDGMTDLAEATAGTNPLDNDSDNDGVQDGADALPLNAGESVDTDHDNTGNNADTDDDNDGVPDVTDAFPLDASETTDNDHDGTGDNADVDDDNDSLSDADEATLGSNALLPDTDGDGINDGVEVSIHTSPTDTDSDDDGLSDGDEIAAGSDPLVADTDGDGVADGEDPSPTTPGVPADFIEALFYDVDSFVRELPLSAFAGLTDSDRAAYRNSLALIPYTAASMLHTGRLATTKVYAERLYLRVDGTGPDKDWLIPGPAKDRVLEDALLIISLLNFL